MVAGVSWMHAGPQARTMRQGTRIPKQIIHGRIGLERRSCRGRTGSDRSSDRPSSRRRCAYPAGRSASGQRQSRGGSHEERRISGSRFAGSEEADSVQTPRNVRVAALSCEEVQGHRGKTPRVPGPRGRGSEGSKAHPVAKRRIAGGNGTSDFPAETGCPARCAYSHGTHGKVPLWASLSFARLLPRRALLPEQQDELPHVVNHCRHESHRHCVGA